MLTDNEIVHEFFQECERQVVVPILTAQEVPYKKLQEFFARFGIYEKFKEYVEDNIDEEDDLYREIERLSNGIKKLKMKIIDLLCALEETDYGEDPDICESIYELNNLLDK